MALTARPIPSRVMQDLDRIAKGDLSALERFSRTPLHLCDWRVRISCAEKGHREVAIDVFRRSWLTHSGPQQDVSAFADDPKKALAASSAAKSSARVFVEPRLIVERLGFGDPWELVDKKIAPAGFSFVEHGSPHFRQRIKKSLYALVGNEGPSPDLAQFEFFDPAPKRRAAHIADLAGLSYRIQPTLRDRLTAWRLPFVQENGDGLEELLFGQPVIGTEMHCGVA
jgi:hypothetical protein